jgi:hypothetical protein
MTSYEKHCAILAERGISLTHDTRVNYAPHTSSSRKIEPPFTQDERIQFTNIYRRQQRTYLLGMKMIAWIFLLVPAGGLIIFLFFVTLAAMAAHSPH